MEDKNSVTDTQLPEGELNVPENEKNRGGWFDPSGLFESMDGDGGCVVIIILGLVLLFFIPLILGIYYLIKKKFIRGIILVITGMITSLIGIYVYYRIITYILSII